MPPKDVVPRQLGKEDSEMSWARPGRRREQELTMTLLRELDLLGALRLVGELETAAKRAPEWPGSLFSRHAQRQMRRRRPHQRYTDEEMAVAASLYLVALRAALGREHLWMRK
jgi:hypothetical protein